MAKAARVAPIVVVFGDDEYQKSVALARVLDSLLGPKVDRAFALTSYDAGQKPDQGGPTISGVIQDVATLPFLSDRRVVVVRDADSFISAHRERLEDYVASPAPTGVLVLECRSFPKTTRLYRAATTAGGQVVECRKLAGRAAAEFVLGEAAARNKRITPEAAVRLVDLIGADAGLLAGEVEKLCLYTGNRPQIQDGDVTELVGLSREERIFAVADAAGAGKLPEAMRMWQQVMETDPEAIYRAVGGLAYVLRRWLAAHRLVAAGEPIRGVAPKVMMWGRERELEAILARQRPTRLRRLLADVAQLDSQAKVGARSIESGIEAILVGLAAPAA